MKRIFTGLMLTLLALIPFQEIKADKLEAYNVSSNITNNYEGTVSNVVDGNKTSIWWTGTSQKNGDQITIEFQNPAKLGEIRVLYSGNDFPDAAAVEVSSDNISWNIVGEFAGTELVNKEFICDANGQEAKYVRMRITQDTGKWLQVAEIEVYEELTERTISVESLEGGTATANSQTGSASSSEPITIKATPNDGYMFRYWKIGEEIISYEDSYNDQSMGDKTYTAVFAEVPEWSQNGIFYFKLKGNNNYLTVKKYNKEEEQSYQTAAKNEESEDQMFILEPAVCYNQYYIKSVSGYYLNCASWNAYAQTEKTTPVLFTEEETGIYTLYQTTSTHKSGYLEIQPNNSNGLYCDAQSVSDNSRWILEKRVMDKGYLQKLIAEAANLLDEVASEGKTKADQEIDITDKITPNAGQNNAGGNSGGNNDGTGISGLTDTDPATYFHSRWGGAAVNEDHYLQIELGETLNDFVFEYAIRKGNNANETSPAPTVIEVRVSENGTDFGNPIVTLTATGNNLPAYNELGKLWTSDVISAGKNIRYIRLTVTNSAGPGNTTWNDHYFFAMGTLNVYSTQTISHANVKEAYQNSITTEQVAAVVNAKTTAESVNSNTTASPKQLMDAIENLDTELRVLRSAVYSHTLTISSAGIATMYLDYPVAVPTLTGDDCGVYIVKNNGLKDNYITLTPIEGGIIPANKGVIVKSEEGSYDFEYTSETSTDDFEGNLLHGTTTRDIVTREDNYEYYVLWNHETLGVGLYVASASETETTGAFWNDANKAYLRIYAPKEENASLSAFYGFRIGTTAIEEVVVENNENVIYDLQGRRVSEITKAGIYIVNGNKILVK